MRGTSSHVLSFNNKTLYICRYIDFDMDGDLDKRSTIGYVFTFVRAAISWASRKQQVVALSSTEAKYIALTEGAKELIWLQ